MPDCRSMSTPSAWYECYCDCYCNMLRYCR
jgi:hypothetical protein